MYIPHFTFNNTNLSPINNTNLNSTFQVTYVIPHNPFYPLSLIDLRNLLSLPVYQLPKSRGPNVHV